MKIDRDFSRCPRCGAPTERCKSYTGADSEFWLECTKCNTYINTYIPQEHQAAVHRDGHKFVGNFGGYGSGKTLTDRQEFYKHLFLTPNGNTIIGANVQSQYEQTIKRDIEADLPKEFVEYYSTQKQYMDFINGHRLMYRPFDDPDKLRSYNVDMFIIIEASEVDGETFTQLKTRLRNMSAAVPERDPVTGKIQYQRAKNGVAIPIYKANWQKGIIESNPSAGWVRNDVLMKSSDVQKHGRVIDQYAILESERDPAISTHITSTEANEFLPKDFISSLVKNKPAWWVNRYIYGSFLYSEGLVYPAAMMHVVKFFEIPKNWKRICAYDYGLSDNSVYLFGAVDEEHGLLYIYKEVVTNNRSVEELAKMFFEASADIPLGGWICAPIIDPKSAPKRDYDKKSLADHFLDYGIAFQPGYINLDARVYRLNTYFETGKIKIMDNCTCLIGELRDYKFKPRQLSDTSWDDKPEDKNNHAINPLEWIAMELPADPKNLVYGVYNKMGQNLAKQEEAKNGTMPYYKFALSDDNEDNVNELSETPEYIF